jgi:hypothetical protein
MNNSDVHRLMVKNGRQMSMGLHFSSEILLKN